MSGQQLISKALRPEAGESSVLEGARAAALIEFTRCLHAEQAAIINAARAGVATEGAVLFSTTFPCHECAKMIVGAGIVEVFYIEPYPKSLVGRLYRDLIDVEPPVSAERGLVGGRVPFRSFQGIAPRRYDVAFMAGERREGDELATFDRLRACPRAGGWNDTAVELRESIAVGSLRRILEGLARTEQPVGDELKEADKDEEIASPVTDQSEPSQRSSGLS